VVVRSPERRAFLVEMNGRLRIGCEGEDEVDRGERAAGAGAPSSERRQRARGARELRRMGEVLIELRLKGDRSPDSRITRQPLSPLHAWEGDARISRFLDYERRRGFANS
jgi:hypothetical protein